MHEAAPGPAARRPWDGAHLPVLHHLKKVMRLARTPRFRRALRYGVGAGDHHVPVLRGLSPPPSLIVDVGAHRGQFLLAALEACPAAHVIAVEPQPAAMARLHAWLDGEPDRERVSLLQVALSDRDGEAVLHVARRDDNSSLRPPTVHQTRIFPGTDAVDALRVPLARLDGTVDADALPTNALLKIDVQGGEAEVLRGAGALLRRFRWVYVECSQVELYAGQALADEVAALLDAEGFAPIGRHNAVDDADGREIQADHLFIREDGP